jgi:autotransporter-associated beta strand protein
VVSAANSLTGAAPNDFAAARVTALNNGNYVVAAPNWNAGQGAAAWGSGTAGVVGAVSPTNSLTGTRAGDGVGGGILALSNGNYVVLSPGWNSGRGAATWANGATGQVLDGSGMITPQNSLLGQSPDSGLGGLSEDPSHQAFVVGFSREGMGRATSGFPGPNQLTYARGQSQTVTITPALLTATLNTGTAVVLQASNDITVSSPILESAGGRGGALTLQAGRSILLNADLTTDNGALTLIANDRLLNGVVNAQRDPGNAVIAAAFGTTLNTGTGALTVELRDGAGKTNTASGAITLQTVLAGAVVVTNAGPSAGSDVLLGAVTSGGTQSYTNPNGTTIVVGSLSAVSSAITFFHSVVLGGAVTAGSVNFAGGGTQTLGGADGSLSGLIHSGRGTLRLTSAMTVTGDFSNTNALGTFDAGGQLLSVGGNWSWVAGTFLSAGSDVNFNGPSAQGLTSRGRGFDGLTHTGPGALTLLDSVTVAGDFTNLSGDVTTSHTVSVGGNWGWSGGTLTSAGSIVLFNGAGPQLLVSGSQAFNQLLHTGAGTLLLADTLTVGGNFTNSAGTFDANDQAVTVSGSALLSGGAYLAASAAQMIGRDLTVSGTASFIGMSAAVTVARNFTQSGGAVLAPSTNLSVGGAFVITDGAFDANGGTITLNGSGGQSLVAGDQALANLVHAGGGTLRLGDADLTVTGAFTNSSSDFDANGRAVTVWGLTTIANGTRYLGSSGSQYFGGGLSMPAGGSLDGAILTLAGDLSAGQDGPGSPATITGGLSLDGASRTITVSAGGSTVQLLIGAAIGGGPGVGLIKAGAGTLRLLGNNTYTGATTVQAGRLVVDGAQTGSNVVLSGGSLAGRGTVGAITASGAALSPGDPEATSVFTGTGSLGLSSSATFSVRLNGTGPGAGYDQFNITGTVNLNSDAGAGSTLAVSVGYAAAVGDAFTILTATGGITGTFQGLAEGAVFAASGMNFRISYQGAGGTAVVLTRVA